MTTLLPARYALDLSGESANNTIADEAHTLVQNRVRVIAPLHAPYFASSLVVHDTTTHTDLTPDQYECMQLLATPTAMCAPGLEVYALIAIIDPRVSAEVSLSYQTVGGDYLVSYETVRVLTQTLSADTRSPTWYSVLNQPDGLSPSLHLHPVGDAVGWEYIAEALEQLRQTVLMGDALGHDALLAYIDAQVLSLQSYAAGLVAESSVIGVHLASRANPHQVSKTQVGLGLVQNYPVATLAEAVAGTATDRYMTPALVKSVVGADDPGWSWSSHLQDKANPHQVTKAQLGLGAVENYPIASDAQALAATSAAHYLTPSNLGASLAALNARCMLSVLSGTLSMLQSAERTYDLQTLVGASHALYDLDGVQATVRVIDPSIGATNDMYVDAGAFVTVSLAEGRYLKLQNKYAGTLNVYIRLAVAKR